MPGLFVSANECMTRVQVRVQLQGVSGPGMWDSGCGILHVGPLHGTDPQTSSVPLPVFALTAQLPNLVFTLWDSGSSFIYALPLSYAYHSSHM